MINVLGLKAVCLDGILFLRRVNFSSAVLILQFSAACSAAALFLVANGILCTHVFTESNLYSRFLNVSLTVTTGKNILGHHQFLQGKKI